MSRAEIMGIDAKASAQAKQVDAAAKISAAMFCQIHNRLCYLTINGLCAVYGPAMLKEHSVLLVSAPSLFTILYSCSSTGQRRTRCRRQQNPARHLFQAPGLCP